MDELVFITFVFNLRHLNVIISKWSPLRTVKKINYVLFFFLRVYPQTGLGQRAAALGYSGPAETYEEEGDQEVGCWTPGGGWLRVPRGLGEKSSESSASKGDPNGEEAASCFSLPSKTVPGHLHVAITLTTIWNSNSCTSLEAWILNVNIPPLLCKVVGDFPGVVWGAALNHHCELAVLGPFPHVCVWLNIRSVRSILTLSKGIPLAGWTSVGGRIPRVFPSPC